eukprot:scaffold39717_cov73-Phaeocystis_antarctica.AAC.1
MVEGLIERFDRTRWFGRTRVLIGRPLEDASCRCYITAAKFNTSLCRRRCSCLCTALATRVFAPHTYLHSTRRLACTASVRSLASRRRSTLAASASPRGLDCVSFSKVSPMVSLSPGGHGLISPYSSRLSVPPRHEPTASRHATLA